ncbi:MAG: hypothetical protein K6F53_07310 [Lachnospiraceae bacterium]|nr:hypothetical protein [Lachnospiraceae bacterium]
MANEQVGMTDFTAMLTVRLNGLTDILERIGFDCRLCLNGDEVPYVLGEKEGRVLHFFYVPVDESGEAFILHIGRMAEELGEEEPEDLELSFGFLVYDPVQGRTEYRSQTLESGEYREDGYYEILTDLMIQELI